MILICVQENQPFVSEWKFQTPSFLTSAVLLQVAPEEGYSEPVSRWEPHSAGERTFGTLLSYEMWVERAGCDSKA